MATGPLCFYTIFYHQRIYTMATTTKKAAPAKSAAAKKNTRTGAAPARASRSKSAETASETEEVKETPFEKLFQDLLKDIYYAEQKLVGALDKMSEAATTDELQSAFEDHKFVTQKHVSRLEKVFALLGKEPEGKQCAAMDGLIEEAEKVIQETKEGSMTRDAGLIIAAQKVEHYEIAAYGSLVQVALTLGHDKAAQILDRTLGEEEDTDILLTEIAESEVNPMADDEGEEETGTESEEAEEELE